jgi:hypothetical protein
MRKAHSPRPKPQHQGNPDGKVRCWTSAAKALDETQVLIHRNRSITGNDEARVILGTAAHGPEQAKGKAVDKERISGHLAASVECLTGRLKETVTETLAATEGGTEWKSLPPTVPQNVRFVRAAVWREVSRRFRAPAMTEVLNLARAGPS